MNTGEVPNYHTKYIICFRVTSIQLKMMAALLTHLTDINGTYT